MIRSLFIPGEPVSKGRARVAPHGGRPYTPAKTRAYERQVGLVAMASGVRLVEGPVGLDVVAIWPIPASWPKARREQALVVPEPKASRPDADNVVKAVLDGLNGVAWVDDAQVAQLRIRKVYGPEAGVHVRIWTGEAPAFEPWWSAEGRAA